MKLSSRLRHILFNQQVLLFYFSFLIGSGLFDPQPVLAQTTLPDHELGIVAKDFVGLEQHEQSTIQDADQFLQRYPKAKLKNQLEQLRQAETKDSSLAYACTVVLAYFSLDYTNNIKRLFNNSKGYADYAANDLYRIYRHNRDTKLLHKLLTTEGDGALAEGLDSVRDDLATKHLMLILPILLVDNQALKAVGESIAFNAESNQDLNRKLAWIQKTGKGLSPKLRIVATKLARQARQSYAKNQ